MSSDEKKWFLYILRCKDNSLYTGITINLERRISEHQTQGPKAAKYLKGRGPFQLVYSREYASHRDALHAEIHIKKLTKIQKERLVQERAKLSVNGLIRSV
ncbi:MAG: GIY-YIG nuclease family protein [Alphaproteobacteria bacterium]|nr:GIY-YIG nuclease family protein [Alphaproteobacteria bacterium]